jgi:hypothetical protein
MDHRYYPLAEESVVSRWRPAMGWAYVAICLFDFMLAPVFFSMLQIRPTAETMMWQPVTLQGGGLFHMAMGAVLGITSWTRGMEKQGRLNLVSQHDLEAGLPTAIPVTPPAAQHVQMVNNAPAGMDADLQAWYNAPAQSTFATSPIMGYTPPQVLGNGGLRLRKRTQPNTNRVDTVQNGVS